MKKEYQCSSSFNHPMVKVKGPWMNVKNGIKQSFNHPMVKVKDENISHLSERINSFNHPMVKVKVSIFYNISVDWLMFQPPYGES